MYSYPVVAYAQPFPMMTLTLRGKVLCVRREGEGGARCVGSCRGQGVAQEVPAVLDAGHAARLAGELCWRAEHMVFQAGGGTVTLPVAKGCCFLVAMHRARVASKSAAIKREMLEDTAANVLWWKWTRCILSRLFRPSISWSTIHIHSSLLSVYIDRTM